MELHRRDKVRIRKKLVQSGGAHLRQFVVFCAVAFQNMNRQFKSSFLSI